MTIAEESTAFPGITRPTYLGGIGFGFKWDMGWMHDTLAYFAEDPVHRRFHHDRLTFRGLYVRPSTFVLPLSHDEVVHGKGSLLRKMPGDEWQRFANLRALLVDMWAQPGKKLLFMGAELAMPDEWSHDARAAVGAARGADARRRRPASSRTSAASTVRPPALWAGDHEPDGFAWIDASDVESSVYSWIRRAGDEVCVVVLNLTPVPRHGLSARPPGRRTMGGGPQLRLRALRRLEPRQPRRHRGDRRVVARAAVLRGPEPASAGGPDPATGRGARGDRQLRPHSAGQCPTRPLIQSAARVAATRPSTESTARMRLSGIMRAAI